MVLMANVVYIHKFLRTLEKKEFLTSYYTRAQCRGNKQKPPISQSFPERGQSTYFKSYCLRIRLLIYNICVVDGYGPPHRARKLTETTSTSHSSLFQVFSIDMEGDYIHVLCSSFCACCPRDRLQYCLALIANRTCIYVSTMTIANGRSS